VGVTWCAVGSACRPDDGWHPRGQIYFPTPDSEAPGAQALWIESQGERIKTWAVSRPGERALLYLGGNAEDVAGRVELFAEAFSDRSLYLVNYRGCGGSSGRPAEAGLVADAFAVFDQVRARHTNVTVMGRSVVSGVAVQVAARAAGAGDRVRQRGECRACYWARNHREGQDQALSEESPDPNRDQSVPPAGSVWIPKQHRSIAARA